MVIDTGAAVTIVTPDVLDRIGCTVRDAGRTIMRSAVAEEPGYLIRVQRLRVLGHEFANTLVHAHDLPEDYQIDGLLGLDLLRHFNYEVRSREGRILVERAAPLGT